tara:strand:+ start:1050 stop:2216 length:1167 start_codon:yes stop_codon:yes gene_type:complete
MFALNFIYVSQGQLENVIAALKVEPSDHSGPRRQPRYLDDIIKHGWCEKWRFEDLLLTLDRRIGQTQFVRSELVASQLKLETRFAFQQSFDPDEGPCGYEMLSAASVACVMIWLERLGFDVDPTFICRKLADDIHRNRLVNEEEITVLTYEAMRRAAPPLKLQSEELRFAGGPSSEFTVGAGYRAVVQNDTQGRPVSLEVHSPKYAEPRPQVSVTCEGCLQTYMSGVRSEEHRHDIKHNKIVTTLRPKVSLALKRAVLEDSEAVWVTPASPKWLSLAVDRRARAFRREFSYDFLQWEVGDEPDATGFLFHDDEFRIVGACCFRPQHGEQSGVAKLDWIWICPEMRRAGLLSNTWGRFRERFGEFLIEPPISDAMKGFLRQRGYEHLIR